MAEHLLTALDADEAAPHVPHDAAMLMENRCYNALMGER